VVDTMKAARVWSPGRVSSRIGKSKEEADIVLEQVRLNIKTVLEKVLVVDQSSSAVVMVDNKRRSLRAPQLSSIYLEAGQDSGHGLLPASEITIRNRWITCPHCMQLARECPAFDSSGSASVPGHLG
jgi:hypothetical protein